MNPLKCPTCGAEPSAIRAIYYCPDGHQWEEHVDRADTPPAPKLEEPGKKLWPFGRHKGTPIEELETDYIHWVLNNLERLNEDLRVELKNQLALREGEGVSRPKKTKGPRIEGKKFYIK